jgi:hypothetical protein
VLQYERLRKLTLDWLFSRRRAYTAPMGRMRVLAAAGCVGALATASAQADTVQTAAAGHKLGGAPSALTKQCKKAGSKASFPVLCPSKFIKGVVVKSGGARVSGPNAFYYDIAFTGLPKGGSEQVIYGAQAKPFTLPSGKGKIKRASLGAASLFHLPATMSVTSTTTVGGQPGIVVKMPSTKAGIYAFQYAVLWNVTGGGGELVSLGLDSEAAGKRVATVKALAAAVK